MPTITKVGIRSRERGGAPCGKPPPVRDSNDRKHPQDGDQQGEEGGSELDSANFAIRNIIRQRLVVLATHVPGVAAAFVRNAGEGQEEASLQKVEDDQGSVEAVHPMARVAVAHLRHKTFIKN
jgi:hypothetical protein